MNIKALITAALVVGSTSLAMADVRDEGGVDVRDHRAWQAPEYQAPEYQAPAYQIPAPAPVDQPVIASRGHRPIFMTLSSNDSIGRSGRQFIRLNSFRPIRTLMLQGTRGKTNIDVVTIKFANGSSQTVDLDKMLVNGETATIDLTGNYRKVVGLIVTGSSNRRASFSVLGA